MMEIWYVTMQLGIATVFIISTAIYKLESRLRVHEYQHSVQEADPRPRINNILL